MNNSSLADNYKQCTNYMAQCWKTTTEEGEEEKEVQATFPKYSRYLQNALECMSKNYALYVATPMKTWINNTYYYVE